MKIKELSVRKAKRNTIKSANGDYAMNEGDITLVVEAEEGKIDEKGVIKRVKELLQMTLDDDVKDKSTAWLVEKQSNE